MEFRRKFNCVVKYAGNINRESDGIDKILTYFEVSPRLSPHSIEIVSEKINFPEPKSELALYQYKKTEAIILAEALSLQWFGNLVTQIWWDDLWLLAYGISNFLAAEIIDQIFENETIKKPKIGYLLTHTNHIPRFNKTAVHQSALPVQEKLKNN
ncbi:Protein of unknown function [Cotesia congregata]|uniref:Peptidase M1 membrane alanine aminopeptidase domain-containing protein n=1 Tax=Cotesia congregata TaxID=51543 RepID=A0A8J2HAU5_COTCN|nr:Protein of unknown function [Cotesia congregata]